MTEKQATSALKPWIMWGLGALFFFLIYLPRVAPGVIQPQLMSAFGVHGFGFGALTAAFLWAYVPMQLPVGMLYDRFGARRIICTMTIAAGIGCLVFSQATAFHTAVLGRFITGFGGAFGFVGAMKLARDWFPGNRLGLLAGLTQALGMLGATFGEAPISAAAESFGWRNTFLTMGISFFVLCVVIFFFTEDKKRPTLTGSSENTGKDVFNGLIKVFKNKQAWLNAGYLGCTYAPVMAFAESWGVSFLKAGYQLNPGSAALAVGLIFLGWAVGGPIIGAVSDLMRRRRPMMMMSSIAGIIIFLIVIYAGPLPLWMLYVLMFLFGFTNTGVGIGYALSNELFGRRTAGTSIAFANMASIILGMMFEPVIGWMLDIHGGKMVDGVYLFSTADYHFALAILPFSLIASFLFAYFLKETYCKPVEEE